MGGWAGAGQNCEYFSLSQASRAKRWFAKGAVIWQIVLPGQRSGKNAYFLQNGANGVDIHMQICEGNNIYFGHLTTSLFQVGELCYRWHT